MTPLPIHLLPTVSPMLAETVLSVAAAGDIIACDFYVQGAERGEEIPGGYRLGRLLNVDHHAPTARMSRIVSSTNLAVAQLAAAPPQRATVVLNHGDCDSVLSGAIMAGLLAPDPRYEAAAIAADHTGEANPIADLLQALDPLRDLQFSLSSLDALEQGHPPEPIVRERLRNREMERRKAEQYVQEGRFHQAGRLAWAVLDDKVDPIFFPALLPDAWTILLAVPMPEHPGRWEAKLRLGMSAPPGATLHDLAIRAFDPAFGGRWNAGSNRRAGGTAIRVEEYAAALQERMQR
ncbi:MAG TPA: hypothetical protein VLK84_20805, partial [Longimicrobium sp.]|nr:hypothetical protein [Longimicrobium sp.]